jgi:hypothetical protein
VCCLNLLVSPSHSVYGRNRFFLRRTLHARICSNCPNAFLSGIGLCYSSDLVDTSGESLAAGLSIGARLPCIEIIRADDWRPLNLQDISPFDGRFRLVILPGDMLNRDSVERLATFSDPCATALGHLANVLEAHIIIDNDASLIVESISLPLALVGGCCDGYGICTCSKYHSVVAGSILHVVATLEDCTRSCP